MLPNGEQYGGLRRDLLSIWHTAVEAVHGGRTVEAALANFRPRGPVWCVAVGKAAVAMAAGAVRALGSEIQRGLLVTKDGHLGNAPASLPRFDQMEAGHPVPDARSLRAGDRLMALLREAPPGVHWLFLISGGTSSLVEVPVPGIDIALLRKLNRWALAAGLDIAQINALRSRISRIKGGRLLQWFRHGRVTGLLLSDVPTDDPAVIGSGWLAPPARGPMSLPPNVPDALRPFLAGHEPVPASPIPVEMRLVADNGDAVAAAARRAGVLGFPVLYRATDLAGDALAAGAALAQRIVEGPRGVFVWGGETTVKLPPRPGRGGRNQSLALAAARRIAGHHDLGLLAAGTDGTDGPTEEAGALVDGESVVRGTAAGLDPAQCLERADAGRFLEASGDLINTGPTGTNVMDLVVGMNRCVDG